jgi:hypothetical protein
LAEKLANLPMVKKAARHHFAFDNSGSDGSDGSHGGDDGNDDSHDGGTPTN